MEGLEATEVMRTQTLAASYSQRIDSLFFLKEFLEKTRSANYFSLSQICDIKSGITPPDRDDELKYGVILLKTENIRNGIITFSSVNDFFFINYETNKKMKNTSLQRDDILINIVVATTDVIGRCAILARDFPQSNITQAMALLRIKKEFDESLLSPYLFAYLMTKYGHKQVRRISRPTGQFNLNLQELGSFLIPTLEIKIQKSIALLINLSEKTKTEYQEKIKAAEKLLLDILKFSDCSTNSESSNIKSFKESFGATGRLDAEFFSPKVTELLETLGKSGKKIRDVAPSRHARFIPQNIGTFDYIEISGIQQDGTATSETVLHTEAPSRATSHVKSGDLITSTVRPIRRLSAIITPEQNDFVCSSGFVVLNPTYIASEVLLTYLKLPIVCELMDLYTSASLYPAISETDILNLPFPEIDETTQHKIVTAIRSAHSQKRRSNQLLEAAKRAVEIAIEESEAAAMAYLQPFLGSESDYNGLSDTSQHDDQTNQTED